MNNLIISRTEWRSVSGCLFYPVFSLNVHFRSWTLDTNTFDVFRLRKVLNLLLNLVKLFFVHTHTLHDYGGNVLSCLAENPRDNSKADSFVFEHVENPVENLFIKQMTLELQCHSLQSDTRLFVRRLGDSDIYSAQLIDVLKVGS